MTLPDPPHLRDHRIDLLRGLALLMIFINHIPGTLWEHVTSRNFGFSDAAEGFVLMSGIAAGLAYGPVFLGPRPRFGAMLRPWRRALTIWWVHCVVVLCVLALFMALAHHPAVLDMAGRRNILRAINDPVGMLAPLMLLGHQFGYTDILPLYVVLMLAAPVILFAAARWPARTMTAALLLWFCAGLWRIGIPTWPTVNVWAFDPLSWQVIFTAGILTGLAMRQGRRFLPVRVWALRLAIAYLVLAAVWLWVPVVADWGGHTLWLAHENLSVPHVFTSFNKTFVFLPRLLHILALAYALSALPAVRTLAAQPWLAPVTLMGRQSLPVFAVSSVLAYVAQLTKVLVPPSALLDTALIAVGFGLMYLTARLRARQRAPAIASHLPRPGPATSARSLTITAPRDSTVTGRPVTRVPSNGL
jgi:hypothetical protein